MLQLLTIFGAADARTFNVMSAQCSHFQSDDVQISEDQKAGVTILSKKKIKLGSDFQSRFTISISLQMFNHHLQNFQQQRGVWWVARLKNSSSLEHFQTSFLLSRVGPSGFFSSFVPRMKHVRDLLCLPTYTLLLKPQPGERAWKHHRGKTTFFSLTRI